MGGTRGRGRGCESCLVRLRQRHCVRVIARRLCWRSVLDEPRLTHVRNDHSARQRFLGHPPRLVSSTRASSRLLTPASNDLTFDRFRFADQFGDPYTRERQRDRSRWCDKREGGDRVGGNKRWTSRRNREREVERFLKF